MIMKLGTHIDEEYRLKVLKYMVLRRIFGPKRDEVTGRWRRLHREELYDMKYSPNSFVLSNEED
jgi:hypothetical protein